MDIHDSTQSYEKWLGRHLTLLPDDLALKHEAMAADPFSFFRATFYRWMQLWPDVCKDLDKAPQALAVGDLHVENFGTWRDLEGRLVWGINDFDEAYPLPYTQDLVRLAASAHIAIRQARLALPFEDACGSILEGYREGIERGGSSWLLAEHHGWLRGLALNELRDPERFWKKMDSLDDAAGKIPASARKAMNKAMPAGAEVLRVARRRSGLGSLGRQRFVLLAELHGGKVAREAKAVAPSACIFAAGGKSGKILCSQAMEQAIRCPDPHVKVVGDWIVRRLSPDCSRIELSSLPKTDSEVKLLHAMGMEAANIHLGTAKAGQKIFVDLRKRRADWLHIHSERMVDAITTDWEQWKTKIKPPGTKKAKASK